MTAHRVAWELEHGPVPAGAKILGCAGEPACVRADHLELIGGEAPPAAPTRRTVSSTDRQRSRKGAGSMRELRPGVWKFTVTVGQYDDGKPRRLYRQVFVPNANVAARELAAFVAEARSEPPSSEVIGATSPSTRPSSSTWTSTCGERRAGTSGPSRTTPRSTGAGSLPTPEDCCSAR